MKEKATATYEICNFFVKYFFWFVGGLACDFCELNYIL